MLAVKGQRLEKARALFVFRQDSGIIAWRSDLQVLYEAHLDLAACSESWFPPKNAGFMWQNRFARTRVMAHSCHSSLKYLLQSTLALVTFFKKQEECCPPNTPHFKKRTLKGEELDIGTIPECGKRSNSLLWVDIKKTSTPSQTFVLSEVLPHLVRLSRKNWLIQLLRVVLNTLFQHAPMRLMRLQIWTEGHTRMDTGL